MSLKSFKLDCTAFASFVTGSPDPPAHEKPPDNAPGGVRISTNRSDAVRTRYDTAGPSGSSRFSPSKIVQKERSMVQVMPWVVISE